MRSSVSLTVFQQTNLFFIPKNSYPKFWLEYGDFNTYFNVLGCNLNFLTQINLTNREKPSALLVVIIIQFKQLSFFIKTLNRKLIMYDKGNIIHNQNIMVEGQLIKSTNGRFYAKIRDDGNFCEVNKKYRAFPDSIIKIF